MDYGRKCSITLQIRRSYLSSPASALLAEINLSHSSASFGLDVTLTKAPLLTITFSPNLSIMSCFGISRTTNLKPLGIDLATNSPTRLKPKRYPSQSGKAVFCPCNPAFDTKIQINLFRNGIYKPSKDKGRIVYM